MHGRSPNTVFTTWGPSPRAPLKPGISHHYVRRTVCNSACGMIPNEWRDFMVKWVPLSNRHEVSWRFTRRDMLDRRLLASVSRPSRQSPSPPPPPLLAGAPTPAARAARPPAAQITRDTSPARSPEGALRRPMAATRPMSPRQIGADTADAGAAAAAAAAAACAAAAAVAVTAAAADLAGTAPPQPGLTALAAAAATVVVGQRPTALVTDIRQPARVRHGGIAARNDPRPVGAGAGHAPIATKCSLSDCQGYILTAGRRVPLGPRPDKGDACTYSGGIRTCGAHVHHLCHIALLEKEGVDPELAPLRCDLHRGR